MVVITFQKGAKVAQVGGQKVPNPLWIASNSPAKVRMEVIFWVFATKSCIIQQSDLSAGIYHCPLAPRRPRKLENAFGVLIREGEGAGTSSAIPAGPC